MSTPNLTGELAEWALSAAPTDIGDEATHAVKRAVLDSIGVTVAGTRHPAARIIVDTVRALNVSHGDAGTGATIAGSRRAADPMSATLANGVMAHVHDWDDTLLPTRLHLSATLVPALLATGQHHRWTGRDVVTAFAIGFEIQARLAAAMSPSMPARGWHGTGIVGGVGVAAAVGRLLELDAGALAHGMGIAATGGAGLVATFGSMSKSLNLGRAGALGVQSAYLAARGFTSHPDMVGEGGFLRMYDNSPRLADLLEDLGTRWTVTENGYKPYPCGVVAHAAVDGVRDLRRRATDSLPAALLLRVPPETMSLMGNPEPRTGLEAKFSVRYAAAVAWMDGDVLPTAFDDASVNDARYRQAMARISIEVQPELAQDESIVELESEGGDRLSVHVEHARGTQARPMSDEELEAKFLAACQMGGNHAGEELREAVRDLERCDVPALARLLEGDGWLDSEDGLEERRV